jgi:hypothetical protein
MDVSLTVPHLALAFAKVKIICLSVKQVQVSHRQLETLAQFITELLQALDGEYRAGRLQQLRTSTTLSDLCRSVQFTAKLVVYPEGV